MFVQINFLLCCEQEFKLSFHRVGFNPSDMDGIILPLMKRIPAGSNNFTMHNKVVERHNKFNPVIQ
jgi:hypothetical protein